MTRFRMFFSRVRALFAKRRSEAQLNEEIQGHLALLMEENLRAGMSIGDARAAARREFERPRGGGAGWPLSSYQRSPGVPCLDSRSSINAMMAWNGRHDE